VRQIIRQIPNFITSLNLVSGSLAVIFAIDGHLIWAGIFICLAAVFDFLDGFAARLLNAYSDIGKQLDSLGDLISFGLAPGAILFTLLEFSMFGKNQLIYEISAHWSQWLILFFAFVMPVLGAVRLARFNNAPEENFFRGLPIPSNGLFWASVGLMLEFPRYQQFFEMIYSTRTLLLLGLFTSGMMVINLPMFSLKFKNLKWKDNWHRFVFIAIAIILLAVFNVYGLALTILAYIFLNIVFYLTGIEIL
jgi:CDP-diacylglycerol--serine O-phosphatidyltransferase